MVWFKFVNYYYILSIMNSLFTYRDNIEGKVGIGKLPNELLPVIDEISTEYIHLIPDKSSTTYHTYYSDLRGNMKENFDKIQYNKFWGKICDDDDKCSRHCVTEMNEIYYSNPKPNFEKQNMYGAAANLIPHRDCILFNFNGIRFYRIIIGLTDFNKDTSTEFINLNLEHKINRGDYMLFDFDRTLHQVKKSGQQETPRILLKLHFIVCENCKYSDNYVKFISNFYKYYYYIARYTEQIGTDPKTFVGFFFGLIWEWPLYTEFVYVLVSMFIAIVLILNLFCKIKFKLKNTGKFLWYSVSSIFAIYLVIVSFYYLRYILFNVK
jgi:hypothetical protein